MKHVQYSSLSSSFGSNSETYVCEQLDQIYYVKRNSREAWVHNEITAKFSKCKIGPVCDISYPTHVRDHKTENDKF